MAKKGKTKAHKKDGAAPKKGQSRAKKHTHRHHGLLGSISHITKSKAGQAGKETVIQVLCLIGGGAAGAALGKYSLLAGVPLIYAGSYKKLPYLTLAGAGLCLGTAVNTAPSSSSSSSSSSSQQATNGVDGVDMNAAISGAKERVVIFFHNFADKLYLGKLKTPEKNLKGLNGNEEVSYFTNPHNTLLGEIDLSALDREQERIAILATNGNASLRGNRDELEGRNEEEFGETEMNF